MEIKKTGEETIKFIKYEFNCDCGNSVIKDSLFSDLKIGISMFCRVCGKEFVVGIENNELYIKGDDEQCLIK